MIGKFLSLTLLFSLLAVFSFAQNYPVLGTNYYKSTTFQITLLNATTGQLIGNSTTGAPIYYFYGLKLLTINNNSSITTSSVRYSLFDAVTFASVTITSNATTGNLIDTFTISSANVDLINNGTHGTTILSPIYPMRWIDGVNGRPYLPINGIWLWVYDSNGIAVASGKVTILYQ